MSPKGDFRLLNELPVLRTPNSTKGERTKGFLA
jgi:hypothetical protein